MRDEKNSLPIGKSHPMTQYAKEQEYIRRFMDEFDATEITEDEYNDNEVDVTDKGETRKNVPPPF
jgi:hypothetical protein